MSEFHGGDFREFLSRRRREIFIVGGAAAVTAAIGIGAAKKIDTRKRRKRQQGLDIKNPIPAHELPFAERLKVLDFEPGLDHVPSLTTRVAALIRNHTRDTAEKAVPKSVIYLFLSDGSYRCAEQIENALDDLKNYHFIEQITLESNQDKEAYMSLPDLETAEANGHLPLLYAMSDFTAEG